MAMLNNQRVHVIYIYIYLVGGFNPSEKYIRQMGVLFPSFCGKMWKIFETTNQLFIVHTLW